MQTFMNGNVFALDKKCLMQTATKKTYNFPVPIGAIRLVYQEQGIFYCCILKIITFVHSCHIHNGHLNQIFIYNVIVLEILNGNPD